MVILSIFFVYSMLLLSAFGCLNILITLITIEIFSWIFVILIPTYSSLNYLVIQSYFLVIGLIRIIYFPRLLLFVIIIKLGLPPFHIWFIRIALVINKIVFLFIITLHKLFPIIFLSKLIFRSWRFLLLRRRVIFIRRFIARRRTLFFTLLSSSIIHRIWIVVSIVSSKGFVFFYWGVYRILLRIIVNIIILKTVKQSYLVQTIEISKCWLLLSGIPPFIIFWLKVFLLTRIICILGVSITLGFLLRRVVALTSYYRTWHSGSLLENRIILSNYSVPFLIILSFWGIF